MCIMEKLDRKHFINNSTKTIQGRTDQELKNGKENKQIISSNTYIANNNMLKYLSKFNEFNIADFYFQNRSFAREKINPYSNNSYLMVDNNNLIMINMVVKDIYQSFPKYSNISSRSYRHKDLSGSNEDSLEPKEFTWNNILDNFVVKFNKHWGFYVNEYFFLIFLCSRILYGDIEHRLPCNGQNTKYILQAKTIQSNIFIATVNLTEFRRFLSFLPKLDNGALSQNFQDLVNEQHIETNNLPEHLLLNYDIPNENFILNKDSQSISNFLRILLVTVSKQKKANHDVENALSHITQNWYIKTFLQGYLIKILLNKNNTYTLYYTTKHYFVIIRDYTKSLIIEVNKWFQDSIFILYKDFSFHEWNKIGKLTIENFTSIFVLRKGKNEAITFTKTYRNEINISKEMDRVQEQQSVDIVKLQQSNNFDVPDCNEVDNKCKVLSKHSSETFEKSGICFERQSLSDCESIKTEEFEDIISEIGSISDCKLTESQKSSLETVSLTSSESMNTEETNELAYESYSISVCESIETIDTDRDHYDEVKYFSDTGSTSSKINGTVWLEDESDNGVSYTHSSIRSCKLDAEKIFNNIFQENHTIYNTYYLHSKKWLRNLFQDTEDITKINDPKDFFCYQQLKDSIFDKMYANLDKIYQQNHLQAATIYWKNCVTSFSQYTPFFKCLGQSLAQTFCSVNV